MKKKIYTDYTVSLNDIDKMVKQARSIVERGFKIIKVKLGDDGKKDIERIRLLHRANALFDSTTPVLRHRYRINENLRAPL